MAGSLLMLMLAVVAGGRRRRPVGIDAIGRSLAVTEEKGVGGLRPGQDRDLDLGTGAADRARPLAGTLAEAVGHAAGPGAGAAIAAGRDPSQETGAL
jgi:hypothetical protein